MELMILQRDVDKDVVEGSILFLGSQIKVLNQFSSWEIMVSWSIFSLMFMSLCVSIGTLVYWLVSCSNGVFIS